MQYTFIALVENKPGVLNSRGVFVSPPQLQHRVARGGADGEDGCFTHDHGGGLSQWRCGRAQNRGQSLQAGECD